MGAPARAAGPPTKPMLARLVRELPDDGYLFEPKWDGFRCLAQRDRDRVELWSRHGRPLGRYFPELVAALSAVAPAAWEIDGEVLVCVGKRFDFEALMARLHPAASRVRALAVRTPAIFVGFDLPSLEAESLCALEFRERRLRLQKLLAHTRPPLFLTPCTDRREVAERWLEEFHGGGLDGVIAKHRELRYLPGTRSVLKVKHEQTLESVLAGIRLAGNPPEVMSLLLGLYDEGVLEHIGVASSFTRRARLELFEELAPLATPLEGHPWERGFLLGGGAIGRLKGAAGRWLPGMEMDWLPIRPERVVEVSHTQVDGRRLRHPAKFVRWRPDRDPRSCQIDQLGAGSSPAAHVLAS